MSIPELLLLPSLAVPLAPSSRCRNPLCRRLLTDPESKRRGFGPDCWEQIYGPVESLRHAQAWSGEPQLDLLDLLTPVSWGTAATRWPDGTVVTWTAPWDCGDMTPAGTVLPSLRCPLCGAMEVTESLLGSVHGVAEDRPESWDPGHPGAWTECWAQRLSACQADAAADRAARTAGGAR